ncbi:hypothetical protein AVEN_79839-1 [Araneus ventricosus]|uniref:Uncharacterized protein n=1 Tax=Araneus ventricosus TaxID=182803 RepID=A0A4Y2EZH9_ARAVE|nr:hypothetical protein AVEN_79839-1 [Araneus ventricosus]
MQPLNNTDWHVLQSVFPCQLEMPLKYNLTIKMKKEEAEQRISSLNRDHLAAFEKITRAIGNNNENDRYFLGMALEVLTKLFSIQHYIFHSG